MKCLPALRPFWTTADFLKFISSAQSFWFSLKPSYDHGCHLANRFRLEPNDYEVLLVVAGLAHYTRFGFAPKPTARSKFLGGGGDDNITINHGCGGGDCGGSGNSDGNSAAAAAAAAEKATAAMAEAEKATAALAAAGATTVMSDGDDGDDGDDDDENG